MIDWHSHILPGMDDGSKDVAESLAMLEQLATQGIKTVIATPHFYANDETASDFVLRRQKAYEKLKVELPENAPEILLGAEIRYYRGISRMENLQKLQIQDSRLLLLEMPLSEWTESMIKDLIELSGNGGIQLILAHVERYMGLQKRETWERLYENGVLMQVNASFFTGRMSRRKAINLLQEDLIHLVGSDCHNMTTRPPQLGKAFEVIRKKLGDQCLERMNQYGYRKINDYFGKEGP